MKTIRFVLLLFIAVLFCQCKSSQQIVRLLNKDNILLNHKKYNSRARKLLVSELSPDAWKNDTIIIWNVLVPIRLQLILVGSMNQKKKK